MPRVRVAQPAGADRLANPREFALLKQLLQTDGSVESEELVAAGKTYGNAEKVADLAKAGGDVPFESFAAAFKTASKEDSKEGNALGWAARDTSGVLSPWRFTRRDLNPTDVLIKITHAGMCHSDVHTIRGEWGPTKYPLVPGHEIVGIVVEVGSAVAKFKPGDKAGVGVFVNSCKDCRFCKRGEEIFCPKIVFTYGSVDKDENVSQGGYSSHIVTDEHFVLKVPDNLPLAGVAPLLCAGMTTWSPYKDHGLDKPGLKIGVNGLGGLGHMAVKWGAAFGCEVVVISRSKAKEAEALKLGASSVLVSTDEEAMKAAAGTFAGIIDTVSAKHDINALLGLLDTKGKLVLVGLPPAGLEINHFLLVMKNLTLAGSVVGQLEDTQKMLDFCGEKGITADVEVVDAEYANDAIERMIKGDVKFRFVIDVQKSIVA